MSLIAPLRRDHPALSTRGLPAPVYPTAPQRPRCPRCHKAMSVEAGAPVWECATCDYREPAGPLATRPKPQPAPTKGREIPMVYTAEPFPLPDFELDAPPVPANHERVGTYLLTGWCQRCQQPGRSYTACRCTLPPDRYVRPGDTHA